MHHASAPYEAAEAYIQPVPYRTGETIKSDLNRLMLLVDDTQVSAENENGLQPKRVSIPKQ